MRVACFSDVHANLPALDAVLADMASVGVDQSSSDLLAGIGTAFAVAVTTTALPTLTRGA